MWLIAPLFIPSLMYVTHKNIVSSDPKGEKKRKKENATYVICWLSLQVVLSYFNILTLVEEFSMLCNGGNRAILTTDRDILLLLAHPITAFR